MVGVATLPPSDTTSAATAGPVDDDAVARSGPPVPVPAAHAANSRATAVSNGIAGRILALSRGRRLVGTSSDHG